MNSSQWTPAQRDLVITILEAFRGRAQDKSVVVDQLLRFVVADAHMDITPTAGLSLSRWIEAELDAFGANGGRMNELAEKILLVAWAARQGDETFFELIKLTDDLL